MLPEVLLIHKLIYVIQEVNIMKYTSIRAWLWLVATGVGEGGWGGVGVGKGIVSFTRPLLVVNIGAACVQYWQIAQPACLAIV